MASDFTTPILDGTGCGHGSGATGTIVPLFIDRDGTARMDAEEFERESARLNAQIAVMDLRLREAENRTDNALQTIVSLLGLQVDGRGAEAERALRSAIRRIHAVGHTQSILDRWTQDDRTDLANALSGLIAMMAEQARPNLKVGFDSDDPSPMVGRAEAQILLLAASELVTNALVHGHPDGGRGRVGVAISTGAAGRWTVSVSDDGVGLSYDPTNEAGSGLSICRTLLRSIGSDLRLVSGPGMTIFEFDIPGPEPV